MPAAKNWWLPKTSVTCEVPAPPLEVAVVVNVTALPAASFSVKPLALRVATVYV